MQTPKLITCILSLLIILTGISCKKSKNINLSTIKIATVDYAYASGNMRQHYFITYDKYNNVDSISDNGGGVDTGAFSFKKFNYIGSSFTITDQTGGIYMVDANTNGQILEVLLTDTLLMTYNGNELTNLSYKQPSSTYPYYTLTSYAYQWNNGDITCYGLSGLWTVIIMTKAGAGRKVMHCVLIIFCNMADHISVPVTWLLKKKYLVHGEKSIYISLMLREG